VICAVVGEWGSRPVNHVVPFIQIRRNHSRKIRAVELKSVITKGLRLEHRVLEIQDAALLMPRIMKLYILIGKVKVLVCTRQWKYVDGYEWLSLGPESNTVIQ